MLSTLRVRVSLAAMLLGVALLPVPNALGRDRAAVEAALREMERSVLAGDAEAYLKNVSSADAIFLKEQQNWAADLKAHTPAAFTLKIQDAPDLPPAFGETRADVRLLMTWTSGPEVGKPQERKVLFPAGFALQNGRWVYEGETWLKPGLAARSAQSATGTDDPNVGIRFAPPDEASGFAGARVYFAEGLEDAAEEVIKALPAIRKSVDAEMGVTNRAVQTIKLYSDVTHLQASIYLSYVNPLGGWNEPGEAIKLLVRPGAGARGISTTVAHEYGHVDTFVMGTHANDTPWWLLEGIANYVARPFAAARNGQTAGARTEAMVLRWFDSGSLAKWSDMSDFRSVPASAHRYVYVQGEHMTAYVSERFGRDKRNAWLGAMLRGSTLDAACRDVLGSPFDDIDAAWRTDLGQRAAAKAKADEEAKAAEQAKKDSKPDAPGEAPAPAAPAPATPAPAPATPASQPPATPKR